MNSDNLSSENNDAELLKRLSDTQPRWLAEGGGILGPAKEVVKRAIRTEWPEPSQSVTRGALPALAEPQAITPPPIIQAAQDASKYPFKLVVTDSDSSAGTAEITILDGFINDELPSGMGGDDYAITINGDSEFYAVVTFDPATLEITSRTLGVSFLGGAPDSTLTTSLGTLIFSIGQAILSYDAGGNLQVAVRNDLTIDINFELVFGAFNGAPALLPVATYGTGWLPVPP